MINDFKIKQALSSPFPIVLKDIGVEISTIYECQIDKQVSNIEMLIKENGFSMTSKQRTSFEISLRSFLDNHGLYGLTISDSTFVSGLIDLIESVK